jgi:putative transposase
MTFSTEQKRNLIEWSCRELSLSTQCELLSISKGALYYESVTMDQFSISVMSFIDRQHMQTPFFGSRKMVVELRKNGYCK